MNTLSRRSVLTLAALGGAAAVAAGCGNAASGAPGESGGDWTLRIGTIGNKNRLTGPTGWLHEKNKLLSAAHVMKIEVYTFPNGPDLNQALVGGKLDLASYGDTLFGIFSAAQAR